MGWYEMRLDGSLMRAVSREPGAKARVGEPGARSLRGAPGSFPGQASGVGSAAS